MNCHLAENQLGPFLKHGPAFPPFIASLFMKSMRVPHSLLIQDDCNQNLKIVFEVPLICQNISSQFDQIGIAKYKIKQNDVAMHVEMIKLFKVQVGLTRVDQIKCQMCTYDLFVLFGPTLAAMCKQCAIPVTQKAGKATLSF